MHYQVNPSRKLYGEVAIPGDKSISHRALIFGAIAQGTTIVDDLLQGDDVIATLDAIRSLGVTIHQPRANQFVIHGVGLFGLKMPRSKIDLGNSGTAIRLLTGLLSAQPFSSELSGDSSLNTRPMKRVIEPLRLMGAEITADVDNTAPLTLHPVNGLKGITYTMRVASAQVKSAILLAGLYASGSTTILEKLPSRDHSERMLKAFHAAITTQKLTTSIRGGQQLAACQIRVPADFSSAAFFIVGALLASEAEIYLPNVCMNPTRIGLLEILRRMGADIVTCNPRKFGDEPVADLRVIPAPLKGIDIPAELVPLAIDEFPILSIAAAAAEGITRVNNATELRVKESDRIAAMVQGLVNVGIEARETKTGMEIVGGEIKGGRVSSHGDHRVAMAFSMAAMRSSHSITISNCSRVTTSFPGFLGVAKSIGLEIEAKA